MPLVAASEWWIGFTRTISCLVGGGSLPRPRSLLQALVEHSEGRLLDAELAHLQEQAVADTLARLEELGCPVLVDGDLTAQSSRPS